MKWLLNVSILFSILPHSRAEIRYISTSENGISTGILYKSLYYKKQEKEILNKHISDSELVQFLSKRVEAGSTLVFYSYSFLGNVEPYLTQSIDKIRRRMIKHPYAGTDATLMVLFRPIYLHSFNENHKQAYNDGQILGPVLEEILTQVSKLSSKNPDFKILTHSMGTRFVEGILESWKDESPSISQLILAAPDIAQDIPINWAENLPIEKITLYTHSADLFLRVSKLLLKSKRAGKMSDNKEIYSATPEITVIEVKNVAKFPRSIDITGHVYFLYSRRVRKDIQREIHNIDGSSIRKLHPEGYCTLR